MYFQLNPQAALRPSTPLLYQNSLNYLPTLSNNNLPSSAFATQPASANYEVLDVASMSEDNGGSENEESDYGSTGSAGYDLSSGGGSEEGGDGEDYTNEGSCKGCRESESLPANEEYRAGAVAQAQFEAVGKGGNNGGSSDNYENESGSGGGRAVIREISSSSGSSYQEALAAAGPLGGHPTSYAQQQQHYAPQPQVEYQEELQQQQTRSGCGGEGVAIVGHASPCHASVAVPAVSSGHHLGGHLVRPVIHYPSISGVAAYHHPRPVIYKQAPIALAPSVALVAQKTAVPVALAPAPIAVVGKSTHSGSFFKKFEDLMPEFPSIKGGKFEGLLSAISDIDLPSLTINMPKKLQGGSLPNPGQLVDQFFSATEHILPPIKLKAPSGPPVIAGVKPVAAVPVVGHHAAPVAITKSIGHGDHGIRITKSLGSLSKIKMPELPSLDSLSSSFSGLGDIFSKMFDFEIIKRVKLPVSKVSTLHRPVLHAKPVVVAAASSAHPVAVPVPPRKIVTAYPLQRGPYNGHVVIEDFPYGRPQYGPFDEGGEATLGCDQLDGAVPVPVQGVPGHAKY